MRSGICKASLKTVIYLRFGNYVITLHVIQYANFIYVIPISFANTILHYHLQILTLSLTNIKRNVSLSVKYLFGKKENYLVFLLFLIFYNTFMYI